jgi:uncharacterized integral membrane protein
MTATSVEAPAAEPLADEPAPVPANEPRAQRLARHARRARLYASAGAFVTLLVVVVVVASENTRAAKLDWLVGSTRASLAWIIIAAAVFGWLLGITTAVVVHRRTRRAH